MSVSGLNDFWKNLTEYFQQTVVTNSFGRLMPLDEGAQAVVKTILSAYVHGFKIMVIGNGGSAAIAEHMHNDLSKSVGVQALVFADISLMTALSNDDGYETVYEQPVKMWASDGDILFAISSSGSSENILRAVQAAKQCGCKIVTLSGFKRSNPLRKIGDLNFFVPIEDYGIVESVHGVLTHYFTDSAAAQVREDQEEKSSFRLVKGAAR